MNTIARGARLLAVVIVLLPLSACVPVLIAGAFYATNKSKQLCADVITAPDFLEKMEIPEYQEYYRKVCKPKSKEEFESAKDPTAPDNG